jgi:hypothetical protein
MKNPKIHFLLLCAVICLSILSCKTTPPQNTVTPPPPAEKVDPNTQPAGQADLDRLNAAMERAELAREKAVTAKGDKNFPDEWEKAESDFESGKETNTDTLGGVRQAIGLFNAAADAYDGIVSAQELADARAALSAAMARAEKARKDAETNQAAVYFPDEWEAAEALLKDGEEADKNTLDEIKAAAGLFAAAADGYDDAAEKSRLLVAGDKNNAQKALNDAMARAEKSRQKAMDVDGQTYFPNDWKSAEAKNQSGKSAKKDSVDEIKAATALFVSAADAYDDIAQKSGPRFTKDKDDALKALNAAIARMEQSRKKASDLKGQTNFPNEWKNAETKNQNAKNAKRATVAEMKAAVPLYNGASDAYDDIVKKDAARVAAEAQKAAAEAQKAMQDAKTKAEKERQAAVAAKAQTAVPDEFNKADVIFQQAVKDFNAKSQKPATDRFNQSAPMFTAAAQSAEKKRGQAEDVVAAAKKKSAESVAFAANEERVKENDDE